MSTKTAILFAAIMAALSYAHDTYDVRVSIRPGVVYREPAAATETLVHVSQRGLTVRVPADHQVLELRVDRRPSSSTE
jgi:hypothetical protein